MGDTSGEDLRLLKAKLTPKGGSAAARRRENDRRHKLRHDDGRRRGSTALARDEQLNFKTPSGTKARLAAVADALDLSRVAAFMRALELLEAEAGIGGKS